MLGLAVALGGCGLGRTSAPAQLFDLGPAPGTVRRRRLQVGTRRLRLRMHSGSPGVSPLPPTGFAGQREARGGQLSAAQMLTDTGVIWRVGDSASPHSYATYRWAAPPSQLVQQRVIDRLSAAGPVVQDGVDPRAPVLQVTLTRFEQVYAPDGKSSSGAGGAAGGAGARSTRGRLRAARTHAAPAPTPGCPGRRAGAARGDGHAPPIDLAAWLGRSLAVSAPTAAPRSARRPSTVRAPPPAGLTLRSSPSTSAFAMPAHTEILEFNGLAGRIDCAVDWPDGAPRGWALVPASPPVARRHARQQGRDDDRARLRAARADRAAAGFSRRA